MPTDRIGNLDTGRIARIMTAALEEFAVHSYHRSSYNRIIRKCGMSKGTMYYYFRSKEDLFNTLLQAIIKEFNDLAKQLKPPSDFDSFWKQSRDLANQLFQLLAAKPMLGQFIQAFLTAESRRSTNPATATVEQIDEWLQDHLLTGQLLGAVRRDLPMELLCSLAWGIWETYCQWQKEGDLRNPPDIAADLLVDLWQRNLSESGKEPKAQDELRL